MNTQDIRPEELEVETQAVETVETTDATLHIQTGVQAGGFWDTFEGVTKMMAAFGSGLNGF